MSFRAEDIEAGRAATADVRAFLLEHRSGDTFEGGYFFFLACVEARANRREAERDARIAELEAWRERVETYAAEQNERTP